MKKALLACFIIACCKAGYSSRLMTIDEFRGKPRFTSQQLVYAGVNAGLNFTRTNGGQTVGLLPPYQDYYTGKQSYKSNGNIGLSLGLRGQPKPNLLWRLGLVGYVNTTVQAQGYLRQFGLTELENFKYEYDVQSYRLMVSGKLLGTWWECYHPYIVGELGAAFNRAFRYRDIPLIEEAVPGEPFSNHTNTAFSWGLGLGIEKELFRNLSVGLGYLFSDLGRASLGRSDWQDTSQTLNIDHLYNNQILIEFTAFL